MKTFNTGETEDELRKEYNPEGSQMRQIQHRMLEMLVYIDNVCKKNNLRYWLIGGTLLGAYRHGGFIPWDDDLDISMPIDDYKVFFKIIQEDKECPYTIQSHETDEYYYYYFPKFRDRNSECHAFGEKDENWKYRGIWIDIFVMEEYSVFWQKISFMTATMGRQYLCGKNPFVHAIAECRYYMNKFLFFPLFRMCAKLTGNGKTLCKTLGSEYPFPDYKCNLLPLSEISFEGKYFKCAHNVTETLRLQYGEKFNELPPKEKRGGHSLEIIRI